MSAARRAEFDEYAEDYEAALAEGLAISGEGRSYFAQARLDFLRDCLVRLGLAADAAMDFGCGTGDSVPLLRVTLGASSVVGVDESARTVEHATRTYGTLEQRFEVSDRFVPRAELDLVYTNGVFHHIVPAQRPAAFRFIHRSLRAGGLLALWENNPWSLAARYVMSKIPFDRGASMISARAAAARARQHGFRVLRVDYMFFFPAALRGLRPLEGALRGIPLGAQYQLLCVKE